MNNVFDRLRKGETVRFDDPGMPGLRDASYATMALLGNLNQSADPEEIRAWLGRIIGQEIDATTALFPPIHINHGRHTRIGKNVFINFDCVFLDLGGITIEDGVFIAPKVSLLTEGHPLPPEERHSLTAAPIHIRKNAWIGANATILQGVTIGENAVIAAGAVVTRDVPDNTVAGGIPARILKEI